MTVPLGPPRIASVVAPTREAVRPLPPATAPALEPYRVLFPLGAAAGILGALAWTAQALGLLAWPYALHATLMVEGFELAFVTGFLLSAMPAFTHGARCRPWELAVTAAGVGALVAARLAGREVLAPALFAGTLAFTGVALARRVRFGAAAPPEEFALVGVGLLLGVVGGGVQALAAAGLVTEPAPRFGIRMVSRGMVLALVLGLGGLLVPVFAGLPDPLRITGIARAGRRGPRRAFVAGVAALLVAALADEALGHPAAAAWTRLAAGAASTLLAWKLWRPPARVARLAWVLWSAGACVLLGLAAAALAPAHEIVAWHIVFTGGYGLLTLAIATRVVVTHGGHDVRDESRVLGTGAIAALALAAILRSLAGDADPGRSQALAGAGALWAVAWGLWLAGALPRVLRTRRPDLVMPARPPGPN